MGNLRIQLRALLDSKDNQVHQAGMMAQRVLAQQIELQDRIMQLQEIIDIEGEEQARDRYEELERTMGEWDEENAALSAAFGPSKRPTNGTDPVPFAAEALGVATASDQRAKSSTSAAAQSRRAKNGTHRADDVEFAFEIGTGLLNEVRRLQSILGERDKALQDMKKEKDDLEASLESLKAALKANAATNPVEDPPAPRYDRATDSDDDSPRSSTPKPTTRHHNSDTTQDELGADVLNVQLANSCFRDINGAVNSHNTMTTYHTVTCGNSQVSMLYSVATVGSSAVVVLDSYHHKKNLAQTVQNYQSMLALYGKHRTVEYTGFLTLLIFGLRVLFVRHRPWRSRGG